MQSSVLAIMLLSLSAPALAEKPNVELAHAIASAKSFDLISLEPGETGARGSDGACTGYCYFGWPALGQVIARGSQAKPIRTNLSAWVTAPEPQAVSICFNPRHGVRLVANGHTYDFVVCFECAQAEVYRDSAARPFAHLYYAASQAAWDALLLSGHVPLAVPSDAHGS